MGRPARFVARATWVRVLAALPLCLACATNDATSNATNDSVREASFGEPTVVAPESGAFTAKVALPYELLMEGDAHVLNVTLLPEVAVMSCWVDASTTKLGATSLRLIGVGQEYLEKRFGEFEVAQFAGVRAGMAGDTAYHALEWLYSDPVKGGAQIKAAAANRQGHGISCLDLNLGFRDSFYEVFETLVASFESSTPPPEPYYREVVVSTMSGLEIGISTSEFSRDADGDIEIVATNSMLIPRSPQDVLVSFSMHRSWARDNGTLINAYSVEADGEATHTELSLRYDEGDWSVAGVFKGKKLEASLGRSEWIDSAVAETRAMREQLLPRGDATGFELVIWEPGADPTSVLHATYTIDTHDPTALTIQAGPMKIEGRLRPDGFMDRGVVGVGASQIVMETIYRVGEP